MWNPKRWIQKLVALPNVSITALHFAGVMLLTTIWRLIWLWQLQEMAPAGSGVLLLCAFGVGLRLDVVIAAALTLPVFVLTLFPPAIGQIWARRILQSWAALAGLFIGIATIVDIEFFREFNSHITLLVTQYGAGTEEIWKFLWAAYPLIRYLLLLIGVTGLWWLGFHRLFQHVKYRPTRPRWLSIPAGVVMLAFLVVAGRGGVQERPVNWGYAIFSTNHFANQVALNPIYFFGRSVAQFSSTKQVAKALNYFAADTAWAITAPLITSTGEIPVDEGLPLRRARKSDTPLRRSHVVLVILETFSGEYCGYLNDTYKTVTPHLDALAAEGLAFSRMYANGNRTAHGLGAILCSWPNLPGTPVIYRVEGQRDLPTVASVLKDNGIETTFLYGGDAGFDNMAGFFRANGFDRILDKSILPEGTPATMWGVYDEYLFNQSLTILDTARTAQFLTVLTVSNHQPWSLPAHRADGIQPWENPDHPNADMLRTMRYVDMALGEFLDAARERTWFDSTLFVFVSDHGRTLHQAGYHDPRNHRIVGLFYGPKILGEPQKISTIASQVDIVPTLLGILNYSGNHTFWGRDMRQSQPGYAGMMRHERFDWYVEGYFYEEIPGSAGRLFQYSDDWNSEPVDITGSNDDLYRRLQREARAYLQSAWFGFDARIFVEK